MTHLGQIGEPSGPWAGLFSAMADMIWFMAGTLMCRVSGDHSIGDMTLNVEGTHDFPDSGKLVVADATITYTSKTATTFDGIEHQIENVSFPGLPVFVPRQSVVSDVSGQVTQLGDLRASFIVEEAEDGELDIMGRNYGIPRPRGLGDDLWRPLLQAMMFIEAQTMYSLEQVLDILWGPGNYTLYEDLESFPHTVFVGVPAGGLGGGFEGKTWMIGGEPQPSTGAFTVDVDNPPRVVFGVYDSTDPARVGTNFANGSFAYTTLAILPQRITSAALFLATDVGSPVVIDSLGPITHWKIGTFIDTSNVNLRWDSQSDGTTDTASPLRFVTDTDWFPTWVGSVPTELVIESGPNLGAYPVTSRISGSAIESTFAAFVTDTNVQWHLRPVLPNGAGTVILPRATFVGNTITTPSGPLPADVLVDYTHVPSAQALLNAGTNGDDQYPFYLWDDGAITALIVDLLTAAGVRVLAATE